MAAYYRGPADEVDADLGPQGRHAQAPDGYVGGNRRARRTRSPVHLRRWASRRALCVGAEPTKGSHTKHVLDDAGPTVGRARGRINSEIEPDCPRNLTGKVS